MENFENLLDFSECYITFRSITYAQRAQAALEGMDVACLLSRTPKMMEERGCSYCLRLKNGRERMGELLPRLSVPYSRIYGKQEDGSFQEIRP